MYREGRAQGAGASKLASSWRSGVCWSARSSCTASSATRRTPPRNGVYRISDLELASRLSFFLWSSIPDDDAAGPGGPGASSTARPCSRRRSRGCWPTRRADAFIDNFAGQWLYLRNLPAAGPVATIFPDFDEGPAPEPPARDGAVLRQHRPRGSAGCTDLLTANYTFLDERLARHYGVPGVKGSHFRRVTLAAGLARAAGLLGHGSILTVTSQPDRTSPVVRGKWVLENFLGTSPPPPPPNVPDLKSSVEPGAVLSMRERMVAHRANPACAGCHAMMDPIGLSLENFDAVGRFRTLAESGGPIDASGGLPDGTRFTGAAGLREALLARREQFVTTLTEKLLTYALGRGVEYYDQPAVRAIVRDAARRDYRFASALVAGVVRSTPFQMRRTRS